MRNLLLIFVIVFGGGHLCLLGLPWWSVAIFSAAAAYFLPAKLIPGTIMATLSGAMLWFLHAYLLDSANESMLSQKVGHVFLGAKPLHLLLFTTLVGALIAKLGYLTGYTARKAFVR